MPPPSKENVLDLQVRQRIVACVLENPGLHLRALAERLALPVSTMEYHSYQLVKTGHLATRETGGFKAFYPAKGMDRRDKDVLYLVRQDGPRRVCAHLLLNPGATPKDLKAATGLSGPTLTFHLKKLAAAGLLHEEPDGRTKRLTLLEEERVANVLVTYRRSFLDDAVDRFATTWIDLHPPRRAAEPEADAERDVVERAIEATEARRKAGRAEAADADPPPGHNGAERTEPAEPEFETAGSASGPPARRKSSGAGAESAEEAARDAQ